MAPLPEPVRYTIIPRRPEAHLFEVTCTVADPDPDGQRFSLPAWIPGSYMIREFARHIVSLRATARGRPVGCDKLDKHTWRAAPAKGPLTLTYEVYAWDLSVRAAHLDRTHGFFNGPSVFLRVEGRADRSCLVDIRPPAGAAFEQWRVATALPRAKGMAGAARQHGFGLYRAADYDELIDHPVEMGRFQLASFEAGGVKHEIALTGRHDCDTARLAADLKRICDWHLRLFGKPAPMDYYLFLVTAVGEGYGGLEHRASTALLCARDTLPGAPAKRGATPDDGYKGFLGLCSHEYFHTWNVKRIKPAAFVPYDLSRENYTRLLWAFEGITSYYDDLALVRSGVIGADDYLGLLAKTLSTVRKGPGRYRQSVAESSFDAWIKYYRQDENSPNSIVSYYLKGSLIALALDLDLRLATKGGASLDDVMRRLWTRYGKTGQGVPEAGMFDAVAQIGGAGAARRLRLAVEGTEDPPLAKLLSRFGVDLKWQAAEDKPDLGVRVTAEGTEARLANLYDGGAAQVAGLSAGDMLVAIGGLRATHANWEKLLARKKAGSRVTLHAFRRDELMSFDVELRAAPADSAKLSLVAKPSAGALRLRKAWLGTDRVSR